MANKVYDSELQYLTVAFAKRIGLGPSGSIGKFDDLSSSHAEAGLSPLLVYSLVAPAYSIYLRLLVDPQNPVPLSEFLNDAWSSHSEFGMPLTLEVKARLLGADRGFADWVRQQGIILKPATPTKSIDAFERVSRDVLTAAAWPVGPSRSRQRNLPRSLEECNLGMRAHDIFCASIASQIQYSMDRLTFEVWRQRDKCYCTSRPIPSDWDSSAIESKESIRPRLEYRVSPDEGEVMPLDIEGIKDLVDMWPGGSKEFFKGLSVAKRDFDFWASGRAHLASSEFSEVVHRAAASYHSDFDYWVLGSGYLLEASNGRQVEALYNVLSHGGDLDYAFELIGPSGELPPMRIAIFAPCDGFTNLMLFERGGRAEQVLDRGRLINFGTPVRATAAVWEGVLTIIANRERFKSPSSVGRNFFAMHGEWLMEQSQRWW